MQPWHTASISPRHRFTPRPEIPQAVRQQGKLELGRGESLPVNPVHQLDLKHVQVVLLFGGGESGVRPPGQGEAPQVPKNLRGIDGQRLPESLLDILQCLAVRPRNSQAPKQGIFSRSLYQAQQLVGVGRARQEQVGQAFYLSVINFTGAAPGKERVGFSLKRRVNSLVFRQWR